LKGPPNPHDEVTPST